MKAYKGTKLKGTTLCPAEMLSQPWKDTTFTSNIVRTWRGVEKDLLYPTDSTTCVERTVALPGITHHQLGLVNDLFDGSL